MTVQLTIEEFQVLSRMINEADWKLNASLPTKQKFRLLNESNYCFHGVRQFNKVEEFINGVSIFKEVRQISDEDALAGLPMLLKDEAIKWWVTVNSEIKSWSDALCRLHSEFTRVRQPYEIYQEIFAHPQGDIEGIDTFLFKKIALLKMLPAHRHTEQEELDMVYGLLKLDFKKRIFRSDVNTFEELANKARHLEQMEKIAKRQGFEGNKKWFGNGTAFSSLFQSMRVLLEKAEIADRKKEHLDAMKNSIKQVLNQVTRSQHKVEVMRLPNEMSPGKRKINMGCIFSSLNGEESEVQKKKRKINPLETMNSGVMSQSKESTSFKFTIPDYPFSSAIVPNQVSFTKQEKASASNIFSRQFRFSCYGCGTPDVIRNNCEKCKTQTLNQKMQVKEGPETIKITSCEVILASPDPTTVVPNTNSEQILASAEPNIFLRQFRFSCYGCGTPNVVKSNCGKCKNRPMPILKDPEQDSDVAVTTEYTTTEVEMVSQEKSAPETVMSDVMLVSQEKDNTEKGYTNVVAITESKEREMTKIAETMINDVVLLALEKDSTEESYPIAVPLPESKERELTKITNTMINDVVLLSQEKDTTEKDYPAVVVPIAQCKEREVNETAETMISDVALVPQEKVATEKDNPAVVPLLECKERDMTGTGETISDVMLASQEKDTDILVTSPENSAITI